MNLVKSHGKKIALIVVFFLSLSLMPPSSICICSQTKHYSIRKVMFVELHKQEI